MNAANKKLFDKAEAAITALFSDTSVSRDECRTNLIDLQSDIQMKLDCLDADDERDKKSANE